MNLEFDIESEDDRFVAAYSEGVLDTLDKLGFTFDFEQTAPSKGGVTKFSVINVRKDEERNDS